MEYTYATLLLDESDEEINERNLTAVLEAADCQVQESRVKALVAALEDVDIAAATKGTGADIENSGNQESSPVPNADRGSTHESAESDGVDGTAEDDDADLADDRGQTPPADELQSFDDLQTFSENVESQESETVDDSEADEQNHSATREEAANDRSS